MNHASRKIVNNYLLLVTVSTLASGLIFGINTLFLLDAGMSNTQAFFVNAFYTVGMVAFEVPTGVVADVWGRRKSFLLGAVTLAIATLVYYFLWQLSSGLWLWALVSIILGLGFTFFSGATEAWLVDALKHHKFKGNLESVFSKGQVASGAAMLAGSVAGGVIAQQFSLGVPYILRTILLVITFVMAWCLMHDDGFEAKHNTKAYQEMKKILKISVDKGLKNKSLRWIMLAAPFTMGPAVFAFYAMQPYLLELYGDPEAYTVAALAVAIVSVSQIAGGLSVGLVRRMFKTRTAIFLIAGLVGVTSLISMGLMQNFYAVLALLVFWSATFAASMPVMQAYLNKEIPSSERATLLSFHSLMGSSGGIFTQPVLGKAADVYSFATAYIISGVIQIVAIPFFFLARRLKVQSDNIEK